MCRPFSCFFVAVMLCFAVTARAQSGQSSDELFQQARKLAFEEKNYAEAIRITKSALTMSPDYADIRIFLGRLYTWNDEPDSARREFHRVLSAEPDHLDALLAVGSLEFWEDNSLKALEYANKGLGVDPKARDLLLLRAKILNDLKRWPEANADLEIVLKATSGDTEARALAARVRENSSKNRMGVTYDFVYFDKQFDDPWHLASLDYSRQTGLGSVTARINYANRFRSNGLQFELDAYPRISKTFQAYISGGYSDDVGVFPKYRAGFSLYANLPAAFEAEAGFRYLNFGEATWIYTASVGKYYKSLWFNLRTFLTPAHKNISRSFALTTRYYYGGADDYLSLRLGTGVSPDNPQNNVLIGNTDFKLRSNNINLGFRKAVKTLNVLTLNVGLDNQEYLVNTKGNQIDVGIGYMRRF